MRWKVALVFVVSAGSGCTGPAATPGEGTGTSGSDGEPAGSGTNGMLPMATSGSSSDGGNTSMVDGTTDTGATFITPPLDVAEVFECDLFEQDCPRGEKCMPYASDGGPAWNATRCSPIARDPAGVGEPCTGQPLAGTDDCDFGLISWGTDRNGVGH